MNTAIALVREMVDNGYCLFSESIEHFAARFPLDIIQQFHDAYMAYAEKKEDEV